MSKTAHVDRRVAIIGGGIGGITTGIALKTKLNFTNFTIYEKADDFGGTWRDNIYPGCRADVATHWYSLSSELNPNFSGSHVPQPEIQAYWKRLTEKHALHENVVFNTKVVSAVWDHVRQAYDIELEDVRTGTRTSTTAHAVISAIGMLIDPTFPSDVPGIDTFKGSMFHSARWNYGVDLHEKKVAVVGAACSASQFIPHLVADPTTEVVNFARSPSWRMPVTHWTYSESQKWLFAHVPLLLRTYRNCLMFQADAVFFVFLGKYNPVRSIVEGEYKKFIKKTAPREYHERLIPSYPLGCKRPVLGADYLLSLHRPNMDLNCDGIAEVVEDGIVTKTGEKLPFDTIIWATGFVTDRHTVNITGSKGKTLQEYYDSKDGPTAYLGSTVPGFPNFFYLNGPNSITAYGNALFMIEVQVDYAVQMLRPILAGDVSSFEVKERACDVYNAQLQARLANTGSLGCNSYYRAAAGSGKNFGNWVGSITAYWWALRTPVWEHYTAVGAARWKAGRRAARLRRLLMTALFVLCLAAGVVYKDLVRALLSSFVAQTGVQPSSEAVWAVLHPLLHKMLPRIF